MRRVRWHNPTILADELWLILSSVEGEETGPVRISDSLTGDDFNDVSVPSLNLNPFDLSFPEQLDRPVESTRQNEETDSWTSVFETWTWERTSVPGKVLSGPTGTDKDKYQVELYPHGDLVSVRPNLFGDSARDEPLKTTREVTEKTDTTLEKDDWILVWVINELKETLFETRRDGALVDRHTSYEIVQSQYLSFAGGGGGGGNWVGVVTESVPPGDANFAGKGRGDLYKITASGQYVLHESDVVFHNTVEATIAVGKIVQLKEVPLGTLDGEELTPEEKAESESGSQLYVIDVESCSDFNP